MEMLCDDCLETTPCSNVDHLKRRNELIANGILRTQEPVIRKIVCVHWYEFGLVNGAISLVDLCIMVETDQLW